MKPRPTVVLRAGLAAVMLALLIAVVAWRTWGPAGRLGNPGVRDDGPIDVPNAHGLAITKPVGKEFTDGLEILRTTGNELAVIESVELVGSRGIEMVGAMIAPPPRAYGAESIINSWPPVRDQLFDEDTLVDAVGAEIRSDDWGWELLVGVKAVEEGVVFRKGIRITYTVDGDLYEVVLPAELTICTGPEYEVKGSCPFAEE
jgi:hypothetical protein